MRAYCSLGVFVSYMVRECLKSRFQYKYRKRLERAASSCLLCDEFDSEPPHTAQRGMTIVHRVLKANGQCNDWNSYACLLVLLSGMFVSYVVRGGLKFPH